ncbi:MAG: hypothetical protein JST50_13565 [Bacteroidetes bacterium]|jgi:hypothetical protein|nr:hypothetical protein [Bacteroidota bacterium]
MIKWFVYIVLLLILIPCLSSAKFNNGVYHHKSVAFHTDSALVRVLYSDTTKKKQQEADDKKKIKEVAKAKRLPKPEKVDDNGSANSQNKVKPKRQRRPAGLERPPEIPRRNGN